MYYLSLLQALQKDKFKTYIWGLKGNLASLGDKYSCFIFGSEIFPVLENTQQKPHYETHGFFYISGNFGAYPKIVIL